MARTAGGEIMCTTAITRAAAACLVSAGLVGSSVLPANASTHDDDDYAWVRVCQYVKYHDDDKDYEEGKYTVDWYNDEEDDSDDGSEEVAVDGWNDCSDKIQVGVGWIKVTIDEHPDGAERHGRDWVKFYGKKNHTYKVTVYYEDSDEGHDRAIALRSSS
jgi:hypothetical protein